MDTIKDIMAEMITLDKPSHTKGNEALWEEIKEQYVRSEKKKNQWNLKIKKDCPAKLEVALNDIGPLWMEMWYRQH